MIFGQGFYHERAILTPFDLIRLNLPILLFANANAPFSCVHVKDTAQAFLLASQNKKAAGQAFNIATKDSPPNTINTGAYLQIRIKIGAHIYSLCCIKSSYNSITKIMVLSSSHGNTPFALTGASYSISKAEKFSVFHQSIIP